MEVKNYDEVITKISKANALIHDANEAKNVEVKSVLGDVKAKIGAWLSNTCNGIEKLYTREYEDQFDCDFWSINSQEHGYGIGHECYVRIQFRSWYGLLITITSSGDAFSSYHGLVFTHCFKRANRNAGLVRYESWNNISYYETSDEKEIAKIVSQWPKIKPYIEDCIGRIMDAAKEKTIERAAQIKESVEIAESLKNFEV